MGIETVITVVQSVAVAGVTLAGTLFGYKCGRKDEKTEREKKAKSKKRKW